MASRVSREALLLLDRRGAGCHGDAHRDGGVHPELRAQCVVAPAGRAEPLQQPQAVRWRGAQGLAAHDGRHRCGEALTLFGDLYKS